MLPDIYPGVVSNGSIWMLWVDVVSHGPRCTISRFVFSVHLALSNRQSFSYVTISDPQTGDHDMGHMYEQIVVGISVVEVDVVSLHWQSKHDPLTSGSWQQSWPSKFHSATLVISSHSPSPIQASYL